MSKHLLSYELHILVQQLSDDQDLGRLSTALRFSAAPHARETRRGPVR